MKTYLLAVVVFLCCIPSNPLPVDASRALAGKVFPLFTDLAADPGFAAAVEQDSRLTNLRNGYWNRVARSLDTCSTAVALAGMLKWREAEIDSARSALVALFEKKMPVALGQRLMKSSACAAYKVSDKKALLQQAFVDVARGMNRIIDVYIAAVPPHYASIDSIRVDLRSESVFRRLRDTLRQVVAVHKDDRAFYTLPLAVAIKALQFNARDEAIRYEPVIAGINRQAYERVNQVNFSGYLYSAILVPGFGPEEPGVRIDHRSIARCKMAVEHFRKKLAPFIIVSGGHVYPAGTPFSEGVEMKKYLVEQEGIAPEVIITEPYARHTTTNVRNTCRLVYLFRLPASKPVLVCTDSMQTQMVVNLAARCTRELGYVPFRNVTQLSTTTSSFYPVEEAFQVNANDPLDP